MRLTLLKRHIGLLRPDNNHAIALPDHTLLPTPHTLPHLRLQILPLPTHPHLKPYTSMDYLMSLTNCGTTTYLNRHSLPRFSLSQVTMITNTTSRSQCPTPAHPTFLCVWPFPPCPALPLGYPLSLTAAQRLHRTLFNKARAMMTDCKAPALMWDEFVATAAHLTNLTRTSANKGKTPHLLWYCRKP